MRQFCTFLLVFGLFSKTFAQNAALNFWTPVAPESVVLPAMAKRTVQPLASKSFQLNYDALTAALQQAPMEFTAAARQAPVLLSLPQADGSMRTFRLWESPVMAAELTARYPELRTYAGAAADGSGDFVRLGTGPLGFQAFIFAADGQIQSVRPYAEGHNAFYAAYHLKDLPNDLPGGGAVPCGTEDFVPAPDFSFQGANHFVADRGNAIVQLKKYRAAIAARGEYTQFYGGVAGALDAIKTALNFIVAIQERDFAVRLELIPNNDTIIFANPNTDPYSGETVGDWMNQNPDAINPIIGVGSYDLGHVFSRYIMGDQVGVVNGRVCNEGTKARGASSAQNTSTEYFYLVAAHEMCHQLSGSHTWSNCPPNDQQLAPSTAYEPGSGSTIMSYAGSCSGGNNVQSDNDPYYHIASILQVQQFVYQGEGATCGTLTNTSNNTPDATVSTPDNTYIPISTPFQLTGAGSDSDGDALTYCWEQYNLGPVSQLGDPTGDAPSFRSFSPTPSPTRIFPRLSNILGNTSSVAEVLPTITRPLTFRLTVRDNHAGGGGTDWAEVKLQATANAGPFRVTYPNTNTVVWNVGQYQTITWDVANTDKAPVNCKKVNILLSTNNGNSFPTLLAANVPNTGKYCLLVPNMTSQNARIRVEAADNVFFDLSNAGFVIQQPTQAGFSFCAGSLSNLVCAPATFTAEVATSSLIGFNNPITFSAAGAPTGVAVSFSPNPVAPGSTSTMTMEVSAAAANGSFDLTVQGTANGNTQTAAVTFNVIQNDFSVLALQTPANGEQSVDLGPVLSWSDVPDADSFEVQLASNPSFAAGTILATDVVSTDTFKVPLLLNEGQVCYWRVRPINECGAGDWTEPFVFVTRIQSCATLSASDLPKNIPTTNTALVQSQITVPAGGAISDVNVKKVQGNHQSFNELEMNLISPLGTTVQLFKQKCGALSVSFNLSFDDSGNNGFPCPPNNANAYKPAQALSTLNGQNAAGNWILQVKDNTSGSGGQLSVFQLELCSSVALNPPFLVNNKLLQVMGGSNAAIVPDLLKVDDLNNGPDQLVFTLLTVPKYGELHGLAGVPLKAGDTFTQADLNNGFIRFYDYGINSGTDAFRFAATDGEGGLVSGQFNIQPFPLGTGEPAGSIAFGLAPNPADESVRLYLSEALDADSRVALFDAAGRQLRAWSLASGATALLLEIAGLPEGIYAVTVENERGRGAKKLVVK